MRPKIQYHCVRQTYTEWPDLVLSNASLTSFSHFNKKREISDQSINTCGPESFLLCTAVIQLIRLIFIISKTSDNTVSDSRLLGNIGSVLLKTVRKTLPAPSTEENNYHQTPPSPLTVQQYPRPATPQSGLEVTWCSHDCMLYIFFRKREVVER